MKKLNSIFHQIVIIVKTIIVHIGLIRHYQAKMLWKCANIQIG